MKVQIVVRKYKSAARNGEDGELYLFGAIVDLPDAEAQAAILHNVAKAIGESPSPQPPANEPYVEPRRGRQVKEE